jgi:hypothetical protein
METEDPRAMTQGLILNLVNVSINDPLRLKIDVDVAMAWLGYMMMSKDLTMPSDDRLAVVNCHQQDLVLLDNNMPFHHPETPLDPAAAVVVHEIVSRTIVSPSVTITHEVPPGKISCNVSQFKRRQVKTVSRRHCPMLGHICHLIFSIVVAVIINNHCNVHKNEWRDEGVTTTTCHPPIWTMMISAAVVPVGVFW